MRILLFGFFTLLATTLSAQDTMVFEKMFTADKGKSLAKHFHHTVDLDLPQSKASYSKKQASIIINNFFEKHTPSAYQVKHKGGGNNRSYFEIGSLSTSTQKFRTYLLYNIVADQLQIIELRIETE